MKTIIERGASWTLEETKLLLALWGQDLVQRQTTNTKRTKEVYEKISEKFNQNGYERTADQVRTRVFNMIAEYRRILKDPSPERVKKCIFFEALDKIYQAKHMDDVKSALDDYEPEHPYSPFSNTILSDKGDESISDSEATDCNDTNSSTINATGTGIMNNNNNINAHNSTMMNNNSNSICNDNNGDSITNNGGETVNNGNSTLDRDTSATLAATYSTKKMKLESSKSSHTQTSNNAPSTSTSTSALSGSASSSSSNVNSTNIDTTTSKQHNRSSISTVVATVASGSSTSTSTSSTTQKHQSLLLPHATTSTSASSTAPNSTPINKIATSSGNNNTNTPSYININSTKLPIIRANHLIGHTNGNESLNLNGTPARLPTTAAITSHQLYQAPVNTFDVTSSALLIDRMFAHLSRESENQREWISLEKERIALEKARKQQDVEREARRERVLIETLIKFNDQWLSCFSKLDQRLTENITPPELKIPPREGRQMETSQQTSNTSSTNTQTTNQQASQSQEPETS